MSLPSFLCIGAQKAATSWLYAKLIQHPDVWMPPVKELHYFDHLYVDDNRQWTEGHIKSGVRSNISSHVHNSEYINLDYVKYLADLAQVELFSEKWYRSAFGRATADGKTLGDITPEYCTVPREGIQHIKRLLGTPKIIYMIRDPASRARSQLRMTVERKFGKKMKCLSTSQWQEAFEATPILNRGDYRNYIPVWDDEIPAEDLLYIPFKQVSREAKNTMLKIEKHIGLSPFDGYTNLSKAAHVTQKIKIPDHILEPLDTDFKLQNEFLRERFGSDFTRQI
ncbi:hypothetical protein EYC87_15945 [Halieaceae bacterium IMCC8485]|uniref:Sulfotransferase n=1 Tax=Candidatus Seongchinamella marina TaxID=2518990 RepID=A0ABT3SYK9_9GAMM|nr:sulfotransferase [Candidatus Seongchinamella marina]MCX2975082.1 hypothetical protein [Candidatus Seongchinamella marina]